MSNDVRERLADDGACCAHLTVKWTTEELPSGLTRGWWECQTCRTHFWPKAALEAQERSEPHGNWSTMMAKRLPCGHNNAQHLYHDSGDFPLQPCEVVKQEPPKASEGCGCIQSRTTVGPLKGTMTEGVDRFNCRYPAAAAKARKYDAGVEWAKAALTEYEALPDDETPLETREEMLRIVLKALGAGEESDG